MRSVVCTLTMLWAAGACAGREIHVAADSRAASPDGSTIDVAAYRRGDFDGDGKRDLPDLPERGDN